MATKNGSWRLGYGAPYKRIVAYNTDWNVLFTEEAFNEK